MENVKAIIFVILSLWFVIIPFFVFLFPLITVTCNSRLKVSNKLFANLFTNCYDICYFLNGDLPSEYDFNVEPLIESYEGYIIYTPVYQFYFYKLEHESDRLYWRIFENGKCTELISGSHTFLNKYWYFYENKEIFKYMMKYLKMIDDYAYEIKRTII